MIGIPSYTCPKCGIAYWAVTNSCPNCSARVREVLDETALIAFSSLVGACKYSHFAYDENHEAFQACDHICNRPQGDSWGKCCLKDCPLVYKRV